MECKRSREDPPPCEWELRPVLEDGLTCHSLPLASVYVGAIGDRKHTARLIQDLNRVCPMPSLQHLKRVSNAGIILRMCGEDTPSECLRRLKGLGLDASGLKGEPVAVEVPAVQPRTRRQYEEALQRWPCNFHEDKHLERVLSGGLFAEADKRRMQRHMERCLREAGTGVVGAAAAAVVDPRTDEVLALAHDHLEHPLRHAVMVAVDLVAQRAAQGDVGYLCTGCDVYVTREPCPMCAMALVHSRVGRVFYGCPNPRLGALGSRAKLHTLRALNHRFEVFAGVLEPQCRALHDRPNVNVK